MVVHTEYPFLWRMNDASCLEGVIDLLLVDPAARRCLVIDWKTNRAEPKREKYRAQIAAYWQAVSQITGFEVEAGVFATATGKFLIYPAAELAQEWARLAQLPAEDLRTAVAPDEV